MTIYWLPFGSLVPRSGLANHSILKATKRKATLSLRSPKKYLTNTIPSTVASTQGERVGWVGGHEPTQPAPLFTFSDHRLGFFALLKLVIWRSLTSEFLPIF
jgi:hypothetical protein